jgi:SOS-response transcriptional repressor LexA
MKVENKSNLKPRYNFEAPMLSAAIPAGLSSRIANNKPFDLIDFLAPHPTGIYLVQVSGDSMIDESIFDGDFLVVDSNQQPRNGSIVIASLNGELTVKTYRLIKDKMYLFSANSKYPPIEINLFTDFQIQGVVRHVIRNL